MRLFLFRVNNAFVRLLFLLSLALNAARCVRCTTPAPLLALVIIGNNIESAVADSDHSCMARQTSVVLKYLLSGSSEIRK
jgi:hypothetical protein